MSACSRWSDPLFALLLCLIILTITAALIGCQLGGEDGEPFDHPQGRRLTWVPTRHYAGWILQNEWGDSPCNPEDTPGTKGQWGLAPDGIPGWSTGLTHPDFKIDIGYHGNPNCCGDQSAETKIWIGGNNADVIEVEFVVGYARLMWKGAEIARTPKVRGQWHTYTIIKRGNTATLQLDGSTLQSDSANAFPTKLIVGGQCWTSCQAPDMDSLCLYGNWNNFGYNITFYSSLTPSSTFHYLQP